MLSKKPQFTIPDAKQQAVKSALLSNSGSAFATKAAAINNKPNQTPDQISQTVNPNADSQDSETSTDKLASPVTTPTNSLKTRLASFTSMRRKSADDEVKQEKEEKTVSSKQKLQLEYYDVKKINERLDKYIQYLTDTKSKSNTIDRVAIQQKIDLAVSLRINKGDSVDFNKFTDVFGFSATVKLITKHRNESIFNKYIQSQGSILVADIEALLPACYQSELKVRRMRQLLEKYQAHLDAAFFQSQTLENKKQVINSLIDILKLKVDVDPNQALELFAMKWTTSVSEIVKHRNKLFETAAAKSEGQELKENIENILRTMQGIALSYSR